MADGGDARDGAWEAVRPVPRARAARLRRQAGPLDRGGAAAGSRGEPEHHLHGHRRPVPQEVPRRHLRRRQVRRRLEALLLHHDLRLRPPGPLPAPQLQLHLRRLARRRRHVAQLLHHCVGRVAAQREERGRGLPPARDDHPREGVRFPGRPRGRGVRLLGAQRGAGDPGHHPVHAGQAVQEGHVEGRLRRLRRRRHLLLPRHVRRVLGLRQRRRREHPHHALQAQVAHCPRQHDGRRPCHWQLPGTYGTNISLLHIQVTYTPYPCHWLSVQVYAMPVFDMIETVLVKKMRFAPSLTLRLIARSVYVGNASI
jgi:hypothetical protein